MLIFEKWKCNHMSPITVSAENTAGKGKSCSLQSESKCNMNTFINFLWATHHNMYLELIHWGRVMHICVSKLTIIDSDNGLSPGRRQAIIWTNADVLLIWPLGTNFSGILMEIYIFSIMKMHLKLSSGIWRPFCLGLNVLMKLFTLITLRLNDWFMFE